MTLASFFSWTDRFESNMVENPEERFSRDEVHVMQGTSGLRAFKTEWSMKSKYRGKI